MAKRWTAPTEAEIEAMWRTAAGGPDFIGPVAPPMWLWVRDREKQAQWRREMNLDSVTAPANIEPKIEPTPSRRRPLSRPLTVQLSLDL